MVIASLTEKKVYCKFGLFQLLNGSQFSAVVVCWRAIFVVLHIDKDLKDDDATLGNNYDMFSQEEKNYQNSILV